MIASVEHDIPVHTCSKVARMSRPPSCWIEMKLPQICHSQSFLHWARDSMKPGGLLFSLAMLESDADVEDTANGSE